MPRVRHRNTSESGELFGGVFQRLFEVAAGTDCGNDRERTKNLRVREFTGVNVVTTCGVCQSMAESSCYLVGGNDVHTQRNPG